MKILYVIPYYTPAYSYGGPIRVIEHLAKELVRRGHSVTVLTTDTASRTERIAKREDVFDGVRVIRMPQVSNALAGKFNFFFAPSMRRWLKQNVAEFDVVHCHEVFTLQTAWAARFAKQQGVPYLIQPHGSLDGVRQASRFYNIKQWILRRLDAVLRDATVVALTDYEKDTLLHISDNGISDKPIAILPNGVEVETLKDIKPIDIRNELALAADVNVLGYMGRVQYIKGLDRSLRVLAELNKTQSVHLCIIGASESNEGEQLQQLADELGVTEHVSFLGAMHGNERWSWLRGADALMFLSRSEGQPMTVLEAGGLGMPMFITPECHTPEYIQAGAAIEVDGDATVETARKITETLQDTAVLQRMSEASSALTSRQFSVEAVTTTVEQLYKRVQS